jgi:hypothetical protein
MSVSCYPGKLDGHVMSNTIRLAVDDRRQVAKPGSFRQLDCRYDQRSLQACGGVAFLVDEAKHVYEAFPTHLGGYHVPGQTLRTERSMRVDPIAACRASIDQQFMPK